MKLVTKSSRAASAAKRYRDQYQCPGGQWKTFTGKGWERTAEQKYLALVALGPTPDPDDVTRVIGNPSWSTPPECYECDANDGRPVVQLGQEPDYESCTAWICAACLRKAVELVKP